MKKLYAAVVIAGFLASAAPAFAYTLPSPVVVSNSFQGGTGQVDFSKPSQLDGSFSLESNQGQAWITAGDVSHGGGGYGFYVSTNGILWGINHVGVFEYRVPLGYLTPNKVATVHASYDPATRSIHYNTSAIESYGIGVIQEQAPNQSMANSALDVLTGNVSASVSNWSYTQ